MGTTLACCKHVEPEAEPGVESQDLVVVSNVKLDDEQESGGAALAELQKATDLFSQGLCVEAGQRLSLADALIGDLAPSRSKSQLLLASQGDPDVQDIRRLCACSPLSRKSLETSVDGNETPGSPCSPTFELIRKTCAPEEVDMLSRLQDDLATVRKLCLLGRHLEAYDAWGLLQRNVGSALESSTADNARLFLNDFDEQLKADPMLSRLETVHPHVLEALSMLKRPRDERGASLELKHPELGEAFCMRVGLRHAESNERMKNGPATQIILTSEIQHFPASLTQIITQDCEIDLFRKQWVKDCKKVRGVPGRPARLYCALMQLCLAPPLLPIKLEDVILREFAVCSGEGALPGRGPGVVVVEYRPPDGVGEFEGMPIPAKSRGVVRVKGGMTAYYKTQNKQNPCHSDFLIIATLGVPVPQMLLPLSLIKRFAADALVNSLRLMKSGLYDKWDTLEYNDRAQANPNFYGQFADWHSST